MCEEEQKYTRSSWLTCGRVPGTNDISIDANACATMRERLSDERKQWKWAFFLLHRIHSPTTKWFGNLLPGMGLLSAIRYDVAGWAMEMPNKHCLFFYSLFRVTAPILIIIKSLWITSNSMQCSARKWTSNHFFLKKPLSSQNPCSYVSLAPKATNSQPPLSFLHSFFCLLMRLNASHLSRIERIARQIKIWFKWNYP